MQKNVSTTLRKNLKILSPFFLKLTKNACFYAPNPSETVFLSVFQKKVYFSTVPVNDTLLQIFYFFVPVRTSIAIAFTKTVGRIKI